VRIALVSTPFVRVPPGSYGGTELVVHVLARALERMAHHVTVFATGDSRAPRLWSFFDRAVWPPDPYAELLHCRAAAREIAAGRFDVVHAHAPAMLAFADEVDTPLVYTLHHDYSEALARYYAAISAPVWRVAISARQAALASMRPHAVVHHGLEPEMYPRCGPGGDVAFFLGRLSWVKGPEIAIEAARRAGLPIVVAGERHRDDAPPGWYETVLAPALRERSVTWLHRADLGAKRRLFACARALLVPIRWEEPFGLVMIEALLAGCPVVAHARGAAPEIVEDGETGFLVRDVDEMADALGRAAALDRRAIQVRARARFSARRMAAEYLAVYRAAGARRRAPAAAGDDGWTTLAT
jgi:glycosyltransferase involved in cell wall biosynthesis